MQKENPKIVELIRKSMQKGIENDIAHFAKFHAVTGNGEHNKSRRKLIPKSIEVTTERKPFSTTVTATLSIKLELTQELTPKQIEYILTSHFKRI